MGKYSPMLILDPKHSKWPPWRPFWKKTQMFSVAHNFAWILFIFDMLGIWGNVRVQKNFGQIWIQNGRYGRHCFVMLVRALTWAHIYGSSRKLTCRSEILLRGSLLLMGMTGQKMAGRRPFWIFAENQVVRIAPILILLRSLVKNRVCVFFRFSKFSKMAAVAAILNEISLKSVSPNRLDFGTNAFPGEKECTMHIFFP